MRTRILIAESDSKWCDAYSQLLRDREYQIETANSGPECLRKIPSFHPDLLILNLELAWGGGEGVLACIRDSHFESFFPVLLTTSGSTPYLESVLEPPVVRCLTKPIHQDVLLENIIFTSSNQEQIQATELQ